MSFAAILDAEFKRVAKQEDISMEDLVDEVGRLTGFSMRHIYNFRTGKWPVPAEVIPRLCKRFSSRALVDAVVAECNNVCPVEVPSDYDLARLSSRAVRETLEHYGRVLDVFEGKRITTEELERLEESSHQVRTTVEMFLSIAREQHSRRVATV